MEALFQEIQVVPREHLRGQVPTRVVVLLGQEYQPPVEEGAALLIMAVDQTHLTGVLRDWKVQTINQEVPLDQIGLQMAQKGHIDLLKKHMIQEGQVRLQDQMDLQEAQDPEVLDCMAQALVEALGQLELGLIL